MPEKFIHLTLAAAVLCSIQQRGYALPPSPVAHWSFDGDALDSSGNYHDALAYGNISYVPGVYGAAAQFHGTDDYFQVASNPALQLRSAQQFTVAAYVQPVGLDQQVILIHGRHSSTRPSWFLALQGDASGPSATVYPGSFVFAVRASNEPPYTAVTGKAVAGQWTHLAATYDGATLKLYVDGVLQSSEAAPLPYNSAEDLYIGGDPGVGTPSGSGSGSSWYAGLVDDVCIFSRALTADEIKAIMQRPLEPQLAHDPHPAHAASDVPQDTTLSWVAGKFAVTHDVYLGETFADVNEASRTWPGTCLASRGQMGTTYTPPALLEFGQTYYWRVDEVNQAPDNTIYKGNVWGFTVEPYAYPIPGTSIIATASGSREGWGPEKTIDGSGLAGDLHGTANRTMWWSTGGMPSWIRYEFDKVYELYDLKVWNSNMPVEFIIGYGAKDVEVEYSTDGAAWMVLPNVPRFAIALGKPNYAPSTTVNFGGVMAKYVDLIIIRTWGDQTTTGLSEVRFSYVPR